MIAIIKNKRQSKWVDWIRNLKRFFEPKCEFRHICQYAEKCNQPLIKLSSKYGFSYCGKWRQLSAQKAIKHIKRRRK